MNEHRITGVRQYGVADIGRAGMREEASLPCPKLSVVVPCYNEAEGLGALRERLLAVCEQVADVDFEIVLVDDGSKDGTADLLRAFHQADPRFTAVLLSRNHGHQLALSAGLSVARGERCLIIDADLQDPPELLPRMMARMDEGYDVVYGTRLSRAGETGFKKLSALLFYRLFKSLVDFDIPLDTGDFRLISRRALTVLLSMPEQHRFIRGMVSWVGFRQIAIPYERDKRLAGETKYPLRKMLSFAMDAITSFSIVPLRAATWLGLAFGLMAIPLGFYVVQSWLSNSAVAGWPSVMLVILTIGGAQLMVMGIFGEYLGRIYMQSKQRPLFVIEEILSATTGATLDEPRYSPPASVIERGARRNTRSSPEPGEVGSEPVTASRWSM